MNLPTKLTVGRLVLSVIVIILLCFPFYSVGVNFPTIDINGVMVEIQYF